MVWQKKFLGVISDGFVLPLIMTKQNITAPGKHVLSLDEASVKSQKTAILEDTDASHLYRLLASRRVPP